MIERKVKFIFPHESSKHEEVQYINLPFYSIPFPSILNLHSLRKQGLKIARIDSAWFEKEKVAQRNCVKNGGI